MTATSEAKNFAQHLKKCILSDFKKLYRLHMARKEDLDDGLFEYESKVQGMEIEIIRLWDNLPDYCKTAQTLEKIKALASSTLMDKLTKIKLPSDSE